MSAVASPSTNIPDWVPEELVVDFDVYAPSDYLADGSVVTGAGVGVLKPAGGHGWQLNVTDVVPDGAVIASEGILTLADRTSNGKIFEIT